MGAAFPAQVKEAKVVLLSEKEKKDRGGADGHVLAISEYEPGSEYTYYWGSAWDKAAIKTPDAWNKYMTEYAQKLQYSVGGGILINVLNCLYSQKRRIVEV